MHSPHCLWFDSFNKTYQEYVCSSCSKCKLLAFRITFCLSVSNFFFNLFCSLVESSKARRVWLEEAHNFFQILQDYEEEESWLVEKQRICKAGISVKDLHAVLSLQQKHKVSLSAVCCRMTQSMCWPHCLSQWDCNGWLWRGSRTWTLQFMNTRTVLSRINRLQRTSFFLLNYSLIYAFSSLLYWYIMFTTWLVASSQFCHCSVRDNRSFNVAGTRRWDEGKMQQVRAAVWGGAPANIWQTSFFTRDSVSHWQSAGTAEYIAGIGSAT